MSVINQMLNDLEQRQQQPEQAMSPLVEESSRFKAVYIVLAALFACVGLGAWYLFVNLAPAENALEDSAAPQREEPLPVVQSIPPIEPAVVPVLPSAPSLTADESVALKGSSQRQKPETKDMLSVAPEAKPDKVTVEPKPQSEIQATEPPSNQSNATPSSQASAKATSPEPEFSDSDVILDIKPVTMTREQQVDMYVRRGFSALSKGDPRGARKEFTQALQIDRSAHEVREQLAALLYGAGYRNQAITILEEGMQLAPQYPSFRLLAARVFIQENNLSQAYYYLSAITPPIEDNVDYYATLAGISQKMADYSSSADAYQRLLKYEPSRARWWFGYAVAKDQLLDTEAALAAYLQALSIGQLSSHSQRYVVERIAALEK